MRTLKSGFASLLLLLVLSCNKTSTVTVNVQQQSAGQAAIASDSIAVLMVNTSNKNDFKLGVTSSSGTVIFTNVHKASYNVSAQSHWNGSGILSDSANINVRGGKSVSVNLLLR